MYILYVTAKNVGYLFREVPTITTLHSKSESQKFNRFNRGIRLFVFAKSATSQFSTRQRTPLSTASAGRTRPSANPTWVKNLAKTPCKLSCKRLPVMSSNQQRASKMCISTTPKTGRKNNNSQTSLFLWKLNIQPVQHLDAGKKLIWASTSHTALHCNSYWRASRNSNKLIESKIINNQRYIISTHKTFALPTVHRIHHLIPPTCDFQCLNLTGPGNLATHAPMSFNCLAVKI